MPPNAIEPISMSGDARAFFKGGAIMVPSQEVIHYPFLASMFEFRVIALFLKTDRGSLDVTVRINDEVVDFTGANSLAVVNSDGSLTADNGALDRFNTTSSSALNFTVPDPDDHPLGRSELSMEFSNISSDAPQMLTFQFWLRRTALGEQHVGELIESGSGASVPSGSFSIASFDSADYPWREATTSPVMSSWNLDNFEVSTQTEQAISNTGTEQVEYVRGADFLQSGTFILDEAAMNDELADLPAGRVVMLNVEGNWFAALKGNFNSDFPTLESAIEFGVNMVNMAHAANPDIAVGVYNLIGGNIPYANAAPIIDLMDVLFPAVYWNNSMSQEEYLETRKSALTECLAVAGGRPVIAVIRHRFNGDDWIIHQPTFISLMSELYNHQNSEGDSVEALMFWGPDVGLVNQGVLPDLDADLFIPAGMSTNDYVDEHSASLIYNLSNEISGTSMTIPWPLAGSVAASLTTTTVTHIKPTFASTQNTNLYVAGTYSVTAGQLYYLKITNTNSASVGEVVGVEGSLGFVNWIRVLTVNDGVRRETMFVGVATGTGSFPLSVRFGIAQLGCGVMLHRVEGAPTTNNGRDSIGDVDIGAGNAQNPTLALTLSNPNNGVFSGFAVSSGLGGATFQPSIGCIELDEDSFQQPATRFCSFWNRYNDPAPGIRMGQPRDYIGFAVEIVAL